MSDKPGKGFLGRPSEPGEERERQCPKCKETTFQTYLVYRRMLGSDLHYWECNQCEHRQYFDQ
jgi:hypothetical protein